MGIEYSTEAHQHIPLTGAPNSLEVIKSSGKYVKKDFVLLSLRENGLNYRLYDNRRRVQKLDIDTYNSQHCRRGRRTLLLSPVNRADGQLDQAVGQQGQDCGQLQEGEVWSW